MTKQQKQYRLWVATAIQKARKAAAGKVSYVNVSPRLNTDTAWSFTQWAMAAGWLHADGVYVYETRRTTGWTITDILHELNK